MKSNSMEILNTKRFPLLIVIVCLLIFASSLSGQSITVIVKEETPLDFKQIDINVILTESKLDYIEPEYQNIKKPDLASKEMFVLKLERIQLENTQMDTNTESKKYYDRHTKKEQFKTISKSSHHIIVKTPALIQFRELMAKSPNVKITSTEYNSINKDSTLKQLT